MAAVFVASQSAEGDWPSIRPIRILVSTLTSSVQARFARGYEMCVFSLLLCRVVSASAAAHLSKRSRLHLKMQAHSIKVLEAPYKRCIRYSMQRGIEYLLHTKRRVRLHTPSHNPYPPLPSYLSRDCC